MKRITGLLPRKTSVQLDNRIFQVGEMRLSNLWELQSWLDSKWECPLDSLRDSLASLQDWERRKTLRTIWDATEEGPATWGSHRARELFNTGEGVIEQFRVVLGQYHPDLCQPDDFSDLEVETDGPRYLKLEELAIGVSNHPQGRDQFHSMMMAWQPVEPIEELASILGEVPEVGGNPVTWVQAVMEVCEVYHWTIDYVMGLTMRQFRAARTGGKVSDFGNAVAPKTNLKAIVAAKKAQLAMEEKEGIGHG
jgi:hypothetical protein